ncbi:MAG: hypothetical protein HP498_03595 [Nitrospira sp.]|nr:hypothetical protein [Nitrospira sp.]
MDTLRAMEQRLSALLEDRTHIGRDLHDCILQSLYAIGLNIEAEWRKHRHTTPESEQTHAHTIEQINRLIHDIRQMIHGLDEGVVQEFDLMTELQTLKSAYDQIGHVRISLDLHPAAIEVLTKEEEREILSIAREALSNCVRHARAAHAAISIRRRGDRIRLQISDDGRGFATGDGRPQGYGLANMTARAKKIGGTLRIQSEEGRGTDIIAEFSLEPILTPV